MFSVILERAKIVDLDLETGALEVSIITIPQFFVCWERITRNVPRGFRFSSAFGEHLLRKETYTSLQV